VAAVLDAESGELQTFRMGGEIKAAVGFCAGLPRPMRVAYEAGPTGALCGTSIACTETAAVCARRHVSPTVPWRGLRPQPVALLVAGWPEIGSAVRHPTTTIRVANPASVAGDGTAPTTCEG
jgi:hypothetical protein